MPRLCEAEGWLLANDSNPSVMHSHDSSPYKGEHPEHIYHFNLYLMNITAEQIKELRDATGISVMQCKKALEESNGNMDKAREVLKTIAAAQAEKKADRELGGGIVTSYIHSNKKMGVLLAVNCETDFVAQNEEFVSAANQIAMHIGAMQPADVTELLDQPFIMNPEMTIKQVVEGLTQKTGERVEIGSFVRYSI